MNFPGDTQGPPPPQGGNSFADIEGASFDQSSMMPQAEVIGGVYGGTVTGDPFLQPDGRMTGPLALSEGSTGHTYYEGDQFHHLKGLNTEDLVRLQEQMAAVGLVSKPMYGEIDDSTVTGMTKLLTMSNRAGTSWQATLGRLSTNPLLADEAAGEQAFDEPTYLAPDYATIAQEVKGTFRERLGRDPDQGEMAQLMAELDGWHKGSFDAKVGAARADFENQQTEGSQSGGTVRSVDPVARFQEHFERTYKPELNFVRDKGRAVETRQQVEASTGLLSAMSERGVQ